MSKTVPTSVLEQYQIGEIKDVSVISAGLVHQTFAVESDTGKYIIQRLHEVLAAPEIGEDFLAITKFLNEQGFKSAECVRTKEGKVLASDSEHVWRMQTFIEGETHEKISDPEMLREAGRIFGDFHRVISRLETPLKTSFVLPQKLSIVYEKFLAALPKDFSEVSDEVEFIKSELPKYQLPDDLPQHIVHGDVKTSNILFQGKEAVTIIDLDTCNMQSVLPDLGDAFRSWCGNEEDDPNNAFSLEKFQAGWEGYKQGAGDLLAQREIELVPQAIGAITISLACRFLTDYFNDSYFGWDESRYESRKAHNLARCRGQLAEFRGLVEHKDAGKNSL